MWIEYHDGVERELGQGGDLYDVKDVASKSADNAARLAALFAFYERGSGAAIEEDDFRGAAQIALWHLSEARRFLGEFCLPEEMTNAARLESWLSGNVGKRAAQAFPPAKSSSTDPMAYATSERSMLRLASFRSLAVHAR